MRGLLLSLLVVIVGVAMVGGGIWGLVGSVTDDNSSASASSKLKTSSAKDCAQVAKRDPRFRFPHDLQFGGSGKAIVQCKGPVVTFSIEQLDGLKEKTFYNVVLEKGRREEDIGTILPVGLDVVNTVTVPPDIPIEKYDFLTVKVDPFFTPGADDPPFRAPL